MDRKRYEEIKKKYGKCASWAIWDIPLSDLSDYDKIKGKIKPNIVMVALNPTEEIKDDFKNFHYDGDHNGEKLRYAFEGTKFGSIKFEGAYMTDIIKFHTIKDENICKTRSEAVMEYLEKHPEIEEENIKIFKEELDFIESKNPLIIVFGNAVCDILCKKENRKHFKSFNIIKVKHYSCRNNGFDDKEEYKRDVCDRISFFQALLYKELCQ